MKQNTTYKQTELGLIPEDWEVKKFNKFSKFYSGGTPLTSKSEYYGGEIPFIKSGEIYYDRTEQFLTQEGLNNSSAKLVYRGDLLYALYGANSGEVAISQLEGAINQAILCIQQNKDEAETIYLYNYLKLEKSNIINKFLQGGQGNLSADIIKNLQIPLPPLPEQQKIAEILSTWDKAIQEVGLLIKKLEVRNKALAFSLLRGRLVNKNSRKISLSKFLTFTPREIEKPTENYLALGIRSHGKGIFHKPDSDPKAIAMDKLYEVKENDFIVNITFAWEHAVAIISKEDEGGLVSHRFPTYVIDQKRVSVEFFRHIILQPFFKQMLDNISPGGAGRNRVLSKKDLLKLEISVPSLEEQHSIAAILNTAHQELKQYQEKLKALQQQKKGLMQQLLTGKIRTV